MSDICKGRSCPSRWLRGTRYAVSDICRRGSYLNSWLRGTRYTGSDIYKRGSFLSRWLRGTQGAIYTRGAVFLVGERVASYMWVIYGRLNVA